MRFLPKCVENTIKFESSCITLMHLCVKKNDKQEAYKVLTKMCEKQNLMCMVHVSVKLTSSGTNINDDCVFIKVM